MQGDWKAKIGKDIHKNWGSPSGKFCISVINERGEQILEFAKTNNLIIANIFGTHKKSRIQTWHSPGGLYHNQIDYILISKHFSTSVYINKTRFPGADIGSDHDMVMMTFRIHFKSPIKFNLVKIKDPVTEKLFKQKIDEKLLEQNVTNIQDTEEIVQKLNVTMVDAANEIIIKKNTKTDKIVTRK